MFFLFEMWQIFTVLSLRFLRFGSGGKKLARVRGFSEFEKFWVWVFIREREKKKSERDYFNIFPRQKKPIGKFSWSFRGLIIEMGRFLSTKVLPAINFSKTLLGF